MTNTTVPLGLRAINLDPWTEVPHHAFNSWFHPPQVTLVMEELANAWDSGGWKLIQELEGKND